MIDTQAGTAVENDLVNSLKGTRIRCIRTDSKNHLWICTYGKGLLDGRVKIADPIVGADERFALFRKIDPVDSVKLPTGNRALFLEGLTADLINVIIIFGGSHIQQAIFVKAAARKLSVLLWDADGIDNSVTV